MPDMDMILALLKEVDAELTYNRDYERERSRAEKAAYRAGDIYAWREYMEKSFDHEPRKSIILDDLKMIRRLCLKIYKKVEASPNGY